MLEVGSSVRYKGIGSGRVVKHANREFGGTNRVFAVIDCPHRDMTIQIPLGDPVVNEKLYEIADSDELQGILETMGSEASTLDRSWDVREERGEEALRDPSPRRWAQLLASYARAQGAGVVVASSDVDLVRRAQELLAAEISCSESIDFAVAIDRVQSAYNRVASETAEQGERAEHFAAVSSS